MQNTPPLAFSRTDVDDPEKLFRFLRQMNDQHAQLRNRNQELENQLRQMSQQQQAPSTVSAQVKTGMETPAAARTALGLEQTGLSVVMSGRNRIVPGAGLAEIVIMAVSPDDTRNLLKDGDWYLIHVFGTYVSGAAGNNKEIFLRVNQSPNFPQLSCGIFANIGGNGFWDAQWWIRRDLLTGFDMRAWFNRNNTFVGQGEQVVATWNWNLYFEIRVITSLTIASQLTVDRWLILKAGLPGEERAVDYQ